MFFGQPSRTVQGLNLYWVYVAMFWQQEGYWTVFCEKKLRDHPMSEKANGSWLQDAGQAGPLVRGVALLGQHI